MKSSCLRRWLVSIAVAAAFVLSLYRYVGKGPKKLLEERFGNWNSTTTTTTLDEDQGNHTSTTQLRRLRATTTTTTRQLSSLLLDPQDA